MTVPLITLMVMAIIAGVFEGSYIKALGGELKPLHLDVAVVSVTLALIAIGIAYSLFVKKKPDPEFLYLRLRSVHTLFREQFYTERIYHRVIAWGYVLGSKVLYRAGDRFLIDGTINLSYRSFLRFAKDLWKSFDIKSIDVFIHFLAMGMFRGGRALRNLQTGLLNNYVMFLLMGIIFILGIMLYALERVKG